MLTASSATPRFYRPRYIAIPLAEAEELSARRAVRQVYRPRTQETLQEWDQNAAQDGRVERQAHGHHHDHVDYGAHTGHHGAFGWYADFPVSTH